jgi:uncharacterized protein DUF5658
MTAACSVMIAVTLSSAPADLPSDQGTRAVPATPLAAAVAATPALEPATETWMLDHKVSRPSTLHVLYGTLGALQALDVYSTRRAMTAGANEINPVVNKASGNQVAMLAVKALSTAGAIYFAERAWKKNRKGAVVLMAIVNGVTGAVVARNLRNAR